MTPVPGRPHRGATALVTGLTAGATLVIAGGWCFLMLFATSIGSKAPTMAQMFNLVWPALAGGVLAIAAFIFLSRRTSVLPMLLAVAGLIAVIAGIRTIVP